MPKGKGYGGGMGRKSMGMKGSAARGMPKAGAVKSSMTMKGKPVMGNKASFSANPSIGGGKMKGM